MKRCLLMWILLLGTVGIGSRASAQVSGWWPHVGLGAGEASGTATQGSVYQLDLEFGGEGPANPWARGFMFRLDLLGSDEIERVDIAPLYILSLGRQEPSPFFRLGVGPLMTINSVPQGTAIGGGLHGEVALGFRNILELYADYRSSWDPLGSSQVTTVGLRVNAIILAYFADGFYVPACPPRPRSWR